MRLSMILAAARAEMRSVRRLARYWMFAVLSLLATFAIYAYYSAIHGLLSRLSGTIGAISPRYLVPAMGIYLLFIFLVGLVFLAFDVRARDERDRMAEVLDTRPVSNAEFLAGRGLGLLVMAWAPVLLVAVLFQTVGGLAVMLGSYVGEPVEPYSLLGFLLHSLSVFALWCATVMLLAVLVRNRLIVALAALALIGAQLWMAIRMPLYVQAAFGVFFPSAPTTSDLVPSITGGPGGVRLLALLVLTAGLLALAVAFHPRRDGGARLRHAALGAALIAVAALLVGGVAWHTSNELDRRSRWLEVHRARSAEPRADVRAIRGTVRIDPGRDLGLDLEVHVRMPADRPLDTLLFTLNPGLIVQRLSVDGADARWTQEDGLLEITPSRPIESGAGAVLHLTASGEPDQTFGYLDSAIDIASGTISGANLALFGVQAGFFDGRYVALMPGQRWLPAAGTDVPAGDPRVHPPDFFEIDLEVEVPEGWIAAGPGRREAVSAEGRVARVRFRPGAPLAEVGLLASRFEHRAMEVAGIELEVLLHPSHDRNLEMFADAVDEIAARVEGILTDAARLGLPYPYGGLTLVESPSALRGYGGGWRMDSTHAMPGLLLLRENGFPTARFEFEFSDPRAYESREGGMPRAKVEVLERFFENDVSGGNIFLGGSRNFLLFQTSARGAGAVAINFVLDELVNELLTGKQGYFSPYLFGDAFNTAVGQIVQQVVNGQSASIAQAVVRTVADRPSVWDRALGVSLAELDPAEDAERTLNILVLKGPAIARSMLDGLGREKTAALLAELLARYRGTHFTADDLLQVARDVGADLEPILGNWLYEANLPGFVASPVAIERLPDDVQGVPRYQTRVHVWNGEAPPGLFRLRYTITPQDIVPIQWDRTEPIRLGGHEAAEIGIVTGTPPRELWLQPYLSLNRNDIRLTVPAVDQQRTVRADPFTGSRHTPWRPSATDAIVVDDLDPGFSIEADARETGMRLAATGLNFFASAAEVDQGLPVSSSGRPPEWSRMASPLGWGTYRRTVAGVGGGTGARRAIFTAHLPHEGRWRLAYHLPAGVLPALGTYDLTLRTAAGTRTVEFDGAAAQGGWNILGEFDVPAGEVRVEVSDRSSGRLVVADAVRWDRAGSPPG